MIFKIIRGNAFTFHSSNFFTLTHSLYTTAFATTFQLHFAAVVYFFQEIFTARICAVYSTIPSLKIEISL